MTEGLQELTQPNPFKFMRTVDMAECLTGDSEDDTVLIVAELCKRVASLEQTLMNI